MLKFLFATNLHIYNMTYCFGFKYLDSVYLYSDSAITSSKIPLNSPAATSFGVKHIRREDKSVTEAIIKIRKISEHCYIALAGDVFRALDMIDVLISEHKENQDFQETINFLNAKFDADQNENQEVNLLIACNSDSGSYLYRWDSVDRELKIIDDFCGIGSLSIENENRICDFLKFLTHSKSIEKNALLTGVAAFYQSLGLKPEVLEENVGGAITGIEIGKDKGNWLGETAYIIFDNDGKHKKSVILVNYGGGFATLEVSCRKIKYYLTAYGKNDYIPWVEKWRDKIDSVFTSLSARNWVFINPEKNIFIIVQAGCLTSQTSVSEIWYENKIENNYFDPALTYILKEARNCLFLAFYDEHAKGRLMHYYREIRNAKNT